LTTTDNREEEDDDEDDDTKTLVGEPDSPLLKSPRNGFPAKEEESDVDQMDPANHMQWTLKKLVAIKSIRRMLWSLFLLS